MAIKQELEKEKEKRTCLYENHIADAISADCLM